MRKDSMEEDIQILAYKFSENIIEIIDNIERNKFNMDKLNENERARLKIYGEYIDLNETYESIKNCLIYINSFPFYPRVAKVDYLKFIYTAYLNEIYMLVIESTAVSITASLMAELMKRKIKVIFCDEKRNPAGELINYYGSHDTSNKYRQQID